MKGRGKNGGKDKGADDDSSPQVIEFTPDAGFDIRTAARHFSRMMEDLGHDMVLHLPHVSVEFEAGCTPKEIVEGYNQAMRHKFLIKHSNTNDRKR